MLTDDTVWPSPAVGRYQQPPNNSDEGNPLYVSTLYSVLCTSVQNLILSTAKAGQKWDRPFLQGLDFHSQRKLIKTKLKTEEWKNRTEDFQQLHNSAFIDQLLSRPRFKFLWDRLSSLCNIMLIFYQLFKTFVSQILRKRWCREKWELINYIEFRL